ncbi:lamin tail domain-containing protein [Couchioplanes caeruleus]|uniref:lamin tail domain-containing protein n=1 Tax=Couchioplanes caeruleus TaxID=56438 RepID=UPI0020C05F69|nr:lamin tail domain-containing protein [Couchioplanes caeruleus]UQU65911.1 lamin tail domain-containing protein [Couchioplanes caeruleus]
MRARKTALFVALGCAAALGLAAPASAADTPTISAPASRQGYGTITLSGTAAAGATVELYESAYVFNDFYPSPDYATGGYVTTKASGSGTWSINRLLDSGFRFYVKVNGVESRRISVAMGIVPSMTLTADNGTVNVNVSADPAQPHLRVHIQRGANGDWTDVASGYTSDPAAIYGATLTGQGSGTKYYRAVIDADTENNLLKGQTESVAINVGSGTGSGGGDNPSTPAPTTPAPSTPSVKAGDVQFSKIQYNSPGTDTGSNTSLNNEWVRLTNRTEATINLKGWTVRDAAGHTYTFGGDYRLGAGKYMYVHTGKGTNGKPDAKHRYWNRTGYIWNNGGDTAYLRTASGKSIDSCKWGSGSGSGVTYC